MNAQSNDGAAMRVSWLVLVACLPLFSLLGCKQNTKDDATGSSSPTLESNLDLASTSEIAGWAWDSKQPDSIISIDIYDGETKIATVQADQFREDLLKAKKGNGKHSFSLPPPASLKDGKAHKIRAKVAGTNQELVDSPKTLK